MKNILLKILNFVLTMGIFVFGLNDWNIYVKAIGLSICVIAFGLSSYIDGGLSTERLYQ
jgi:hypothetical protein